MARSSFRGMAAIRPELKVELTPKPTWVAREDRLLRFDIGGLDNRQPLVEFGSMEGGNCLGRLMLARENLLTRASDWNAPRDRQTHEQRRY